MSINNKNIQLSSERTKEGALIFFFRYERINITYKSKEKSVLSSRFERLDFSIRTWSIILLSQIRWFDETTNLFDSCSDKIKSLISNEHIIKEWVSFEIYITLNIRTAEYTHSRTLVSGISNILQQWYCTKSIWGKNYKVCCWNTLKAMPITSQLLKALFPPFC